MSKRICVLGSNSGRNAGDAAILSSIIYNLSRIRPGTEFEVPVPRKSDLYSRYDRSVARAVPMMPWNFSLRLLGIPTLLSILRSDIVLITDGIIFDVKLFNPLFNFLIFLVLLVPFAKLFRKKVVCLLVGVGPLETRCGRKFAGFVCNLCDDILVREQDSADLLKSVGVDGGKIMVYADAAFVDIAAPAERVRAILAENDLADCTNMVGLNVNSYLGRWLDDKDGGIDEVRLANELADGMDRIINNLKCKVVFVLTQVMDINFAEKVISRMKERAGVVVLSNERYSSEELMGVLGSMRLFIGMRLHSLILASAMDVPCIGLAYAPKVRHFMSLLGMDEFKLELSGLTGAVLAEKVMDMTRCESEIRPRFKDRTRELRQLARQGFECFCDKYL